MHLQEYESTYVQEVILGNIIYNGKILQTTYMLQHRKLSEETMIQIHNVVSNSYIYF